MGKLIGREHIAMQKLGWLIALAAMLVIVGCAGGGGEEDGDDTSTTGTVTGSVTEVNGGGVEGVDVHIGGHSKFTDRNGLFPVTGVPAGTQTITVTPPSSYDLYSNEPMQCEVVAGQSTPLDPIWVARDSSGPPLPPTPPPGG